MTPFALNAVKNLRNANHDPFSIPLGFFTIWVQEISPVGAISPVKKSLI